MPSNSINCLRDTDLPVNVIYHLIKLVDLNTAFSEPQFRPKNGITLDQKVRGKFYAFMFKFASPLQSGFEHAYQSVCSDERKLGIFILFTIWYY